MDEDEINTAGLYGGGGGSETKVETDDK